MGLSYASQQPFDPNTSPLIQKSSPVGGIDMGHSYRIPLITATIRNAPDTNTQSNYLLSQMGGVFDRYIATMKQSFEPVKLSFSYQEKDEYKKTELPTLKFNPDPRENYTHENLKTAVSQGKEGEKKDSSEHETKYEDVKDELRKVYPPFSSFKKCIIDMATSYGDSKRNKRVYYVNEVDSSEEVSSDELYELTVKLAAHLPYPKKRVAYIRNEQAMYPFQNRLEEEHQDASPGPNLKLVGTISPEQLERKVMPVRTSSGIEKLLAA